LNWQARYAEAEQLLSGLEPATDRQRARITSVRSNAMFWGSGDLERAVEVSASSESLLEDRHLIDHVRAHRSSILLFGGRISDALDTARPIIDRGDANDGNTFAALATIVPALALLGRGREALEALRPFEQA